MNIQVVYILTCDACDTEVRQQYAMHQLEVLASFTVPDGWYQVEDVLLCPRHHVELVVDGKALGMCVPKMTEEFL